MITGYSGYFNPSLKATIASGQTVSAAIPMGGFSLVGISLPAAFTGTALTFQSCDTLGGTYQPLKNSAGAVSYTVSQGDNYAIDPKDFQGVAFLKIVSGTAEGADRILTLAVKG